MLLKICNKLIHSKRMKGYVYKFIQIMYFDEWKIKNLKFINF